MHDLSAKQRAHLRSLSHPLKPIFHVGKDGLTDSSVVAIRQAFNKRELMKVRVLEAAPDEAREVADGLAKTIDGRTTVVHVMGNVVTLYRAHPDQPEIKLPN